MPQTSNIGTTIKDFRKEIEWKDCYKIGTDMIYKIIVSILLNFVLVIFLQYDKMFFFKKTLVCLACTILKVNEESSNL